MRVGCIQSNYIPWRGYFDFIDSVDLFLFHDDVQYTKGDWRNRNRFKFKKPSRNGWITVPVHYKDPNQLICDTEIDYSTDWQTSHLNKFRENYREAKFYSEAAMILENAFHARDKTISLLNVRLIRSICDYYDIRTVLRFVSDFGCEGSKTDKLVQLMGRVGAKTYLSGPAGKNYIEEDKFKEAGISIEWKKYDYKPYDQLWGPFDGLVTILDTIANCGHDKSILK